MHSTLFDFIEKYISLNTAEQNAIIDLDLRYPPTVANGNARIFRSSERQMGEIFLG